MTGVWSFNIEGGPDAAANIRSIMRGLSDMDIHGEVRFNVGGSTKTGDRTGLVQTDGIGQSGSSEPAFVQEELGPSTPLGGLVMGRFPHDTKSIGDDAPGKFAPPPLRVEDSKNVSLWGIAADPVESNVIAKTFANAVSRSVAGLTDRLSQYGVSASFEASTDGNQEILILVPNTGQRRVNVAMLDSGSTSERRGHLVTKKFLKELGDPQVEKLDAQVLAECLGDSVTITESIELKVYRRCSYEDGSVRHSVPLHITFQVFDDSKRTAIFGDVLLGLEYVRKLRYAFAPTFVAPFRVQNEGTYRLLKAHVDPSDLSVAQRQMIEAANSLVLEEQKQFERMQQQRQDQQIGTVSSHAVTSSGQDVEASQHQNQP
jgi:hypothetical protein